MLFVNREKDTELKRNTMMNLKIEAWDELKSGWGSLYFKHVYVTTGTILREHRMPELSEHSL